ncbi:methyl-accepting chemotaxis protein [Marinomonas ostreistagni]|uniref:methyl-accepting chemotaxis protein n=1 Tax=Marinomonas ostreistagni TaxID=359209 RepID=UPI001951F5B2|nr:methyl-accepting chemotaxis protein [Marinomonas ostreistagni]MBM6552175.1 HAMP domain-containing protein [Marinomonas ostreistagni]
MSLSVVKRVLLGFGVLLVLLFIVAASGVGGLNTVQERIEVVTGKIAAISDGSNALSAELAKTSSAVLQYLVASSDEALNSAQEQYQTGQQNVQQQSARLIESVAQYPDVSASVKTIDQQALTFFDVADRAIADHNRMIALQRTLADLKLDLKDELSFLIEDLESLESFPDTQEQAFAAGLAKTQMESLSLLVGDYFDSASISALEDIRDEMSKAFGPIDKVSERLGDDGLAANIARVRQWVEADDGVVAQYLELNQIEVDSERAATALLAGLEAMQAEQAQLLSRVNELREQAKQRALDASSQAKGISYLVVAISVVIALLIAYWVSISIRRPLAKILTILDLIAQGDLTQRLQVTSNDEFGKLSHWVNTLVEKLNGVIKDIDDASNKVVSSADTVYASSGHTQSMMQEQSDKTMAVATSMNEMSTTVREVAQHAEVTLEKVRQVDENAEHSLQRMTNSIHQVEALVAQLDDSAQVVQQVNQYSQNIGNILEVIQEIAEQTNLLALNAAIEAARAGEQGRGFAVVADEVRTLANRTHTSTEEIQKVITELQGGVQKTVQTMEASRQSAHDSMEEAQSVGQVLEGLREFMSEIRDLSMQIATSAEQQSHVSQDINQSVHDISDSSRQAAQDALDGQRNCQHMNELAQHQRSLVGQFKTA